jgi:hypothetical protein
MGDSYAIHKLFNSRHDNSRKRLLICHYPCAPVAADVNDSGWALAGALFAYAAAQDAAVA